MSVEDRTNSGTIADDFAPLAYSETYATATESAPAAPEPASVLTALTGIAVLAGLKRKLSR